MAAQPLLARTCRLGRGSKSAAVRGTADVALTIRDGSTSPIADVAGLPEQGILGMEHAKTSTCSSG